MTELMKYSSYVTGKRVIVEINVTDTGGLDYTYTTDSELSGRDVVMLQEEAARQAKAALNSKILLG